MRLRISFVLLFAVFSLSLAADTITVVSSSNAVFSAIAQSRPGDVIILADGEYAESNKLVITHPLTKTAIGTCRQNQNGQQHRQNNHKHRNSSFGFGILHSMTPPGSRLFVFYILESRLYDTISVVIRILQIPSCFY